MSSDNEFFSFMFKMVLLLAAIMFIIMLPGGLALVFRSEAERKVSEFKSCMESKGATAEVCKALVEDSWLDKKR